MKSKKTIMIFITIMLTACSSKNTLETPFLSGLNDLKSGNTILQQIFFKQKSQKYDNEKIKTYGYINKTQFRIYSGGDFWDPALNDEEFRNLVSVKLYKNYQNGELLKVDECKGGDENLVELHGVFHIQKTTNGEDESYYLTDVEVIYDFDTIPINEGGKGEKFQCYPQKVYGTGTN